MSNETPPPLETDCKKNMVKLGEAIDVCLASLPAPTAPSDTSLKIPSKEIPRLTYAILGKIPKRDITRLFGKVSLDSYIKCPPPALALEKKHIGEDKMETVLSVILQDFNSFFSGALSNDQIEDLSVDICCSVLGNLSVEEVYTVLRDLKGRKIYKLTANVVLCALTDYLNQRITCAEASSYDRAMIHKEGDVRKPDYYKIVDEQRVRRRRAYKKRKKSK